MVDNGRFSHCRPHVQEYMFPTSISITLVEQKTSNGPLKKVTFTAVLLYSITCVCVHVCVVCVYV